MIKENLLTILQEMDEVTKLFQIEPFDIYILGGSACILGDYTTRATMDVDFVKQPAAKTALANQGIYNGMLGLLILIVFFFFRMPTLITVWQLLLAFVVVVAIFGGFTASKKIFVVQMLPALIAFILLFF